MRVALQSDLIDMRFVRGVRRATAIAVGLLLGQALAPAQTKPGELGQLPLVPPKRRALVVGVSNYKNLGTLDFAASDAEKFRKILLDKFRFTPDSVRFLSDLDPSAGTKPDGPVTSTSIRDELNKLIADPSLNKGDLFLLYFSGHGVGTAKGDFLCPADATLQNVEEVGVPVKEVIASFVKAGLKNVLVIADACRSGQSNNFGEELISLGKKSNIGILLGCAPGQRSYEYPDLGGGAFTYFLNKTLKDESVRTSYGALWASKVAESLASKVKSYTAKDYGDHAQVPTAWADGATDILIGAYPPKTWDRNNLVAFQSDAKVLTKDLYASATLEVANNLILENKYAECIDMLKALDGIGGATEDSTFMLASSLMLTGRFAESDRLFLRIINSGESSVTRYRAGALCQSRELSTTQKLEFVKKLWQSDPDEVNALVAYSAVHASLGSGDFDVLIPDLIRKTDEKSRVHWMCIGDLALKQGKPKEAVLAYQTAIRQPQDQMLLDSQIRMVIYPVLMIHGTQVERDTLIDDGLKDPDSRGAWLSYQALELYKSARYDEALAKALEAAKCETLDSYSMMRCISATGYKCSQLVPDFERQAKQRPYDWRALLAVGIVHGIQNGKKDDHDELVKLDRYSDDILTVLGELYPLLEGILLDAKKRANLPQKFLDGYYESSFHELVGLAPGFGYDQNLWWMFTTYGEQIQFGFQADWFYKRFGQPLANANTLGPNGVTAGYFLAISQGDYARAEKLSTNPNLIEPDRTIIRLNWATVQLVLGKTKEAEAVLNSLPPAVADNQASAVGVRAYLSAVKGSKSDLEALPKELDDSSQALAGLAWARLGDWKRAEPLLRGPIDRLSWMTLPVQYEALRVLSDHLRVTSRAAEADEIANGAVFSYPGSLNQAKLHFGTNPSLADFVGDRQYSFNWAGDLPYDPKNSTHLFELEGSGGGRGKLRVQIDPSGTATLTFAKQGGSPLIFKGSIDKFGNLRARAGKSSEIQVAAKVIPQSYLVQKAYSQTGQYYAILDGNGRMERALAKPPEKSTHVHTSPAKTGTKKKAGR